MEVWDVLAASAIAPLEINSKRRQKERVRVVFCPDFVVVAFRAIEVDVSEYFSVLKVLSNFSREFVVRSSAIQYKGLTKLSPYTELSLLYTMYQFCEVRFNGSVTLGLWPFRRLTLTD